MPLPPVINQSTELGKNKPKQPGQGLVQQNPQIPASASQSSTPKTSPVSSGVAPVQSNLPSMTPAAGSPQQTQVQPRSTIQKQQAPVSYQQQAAAISDPRFSKALSLKLQEDIASKQAQLQQQQAQFQKQLQESQQPAASANRMQEILNKVTSGQASEAELSEYENLQKMQYAGPTGLEQTANIAALTQLAANPMLLAQQYGGFVPSGVRPGDIQKATAMLQVSPQLQEARRQAMALAGEAEELGQASEQQAALTKGAIEGLRERALTSVKAKEQELMTGLSEEQKSQIESKKQALDNIKSGLFFGRKIEAPDLERLGLSREDVQGLKGLNLSNIEGFEDVKTSEELDKRVENLKNKVRSNEPLTPEQTKLLNAFDVMKGLERSTDETSSFAYASKQDLAKINALRRLTGQAPLKEEDLGKGLESGGVKASDLANLKGILGSLSSEGYGARKDEIISRMDSIKSTLKAKTGGKGGLSPKRRQALKDELVTLEKELGTMSDIYKDIALYEPQASFTSNETVDLKKPISAIEPAVTSSSRRSDSRGRK